MPTLDAAQPDLAPRPLTDYLDLEIVRAQVVNCLQMAVGLFQKHNPGLSAALVFGRVSDLGAMLTMFNNHGEPRLYLFTVHDPDGSRAHLARLDESGADLELDAFDQGFISAISASLKPTLAASYPQMVRDPVQPTHAASELLQ